MVSTSINMTAAKSSFQQFMKAKMKVDAIPGSIMQMAAYDGRVCKKVHSPDNAACEGFFGRLKNEMFYTHDWQT